MPNRSIGRVARRSDERVKLVGEEQPVLPDTAGDRPGQPRRQQRTLKAGEQVGQRRRNVHLARAREASDPGRHRRVAHAAQRDHGDRDTLEPRARVPPVGHIARCSCGRRGLTAPRDLPIPAGADGGAHAEGTEQQGDAHRQPQRHKEHASDARAPPAERDPQAQTEEADRPASGHRGLGEHAVADDELAVRVRGDARLVRDQHHGGALVLERHPPSGSSPARRSASRASRWARPRTPRGGRSRAPVRRRRAGPALPTSRPHAGLPPRRRRAEPATRAPALPRRAAGAPRAEGAATRCRRP